MFWQKILLLPIRNPGAFLIAFQNFPVAPIPRAAELTNSVFCVIMIKIEETPKKQRFDGISSSNSATDERNAFLSESINK